MKKIRTISLADDALHWLIARAQNLHVTIDILDDTGPRSLCTQRIQNQSMAPTTRIRLTARLEVFGKSSFEPNYSNDPNQAQKIIEKEKIGSHWNHSLNCWCASLKETLAYGGTQLKASMMCYAIHHYGEIVDVPPELLTGMEIPLIERSGSSKIKSIHDVNSWIVNN